MEVKEKVEKLGSITSLVPMPHIVFTADTDIWYCQVSITIVLNCSGMPGNKWATPVLFLGLPFFVTWFAFSIIHGSGRVMKKGEGLHGNTYHVAWMRGGHRGTAPSLRTRPMKN